MKPVFRLLLAVSAAALVTPAFAQQDFERRRNERLFEANVTEVRAVMGPPEQRCWIESERVQREEHSTGGGVAGAIIGGILGHQIGGGSGRALATVGGVAAGAVVGSKLGGRADTTQDVQRCENVSSETRPTFWDVTYEFRGIVHHVQLGAPPGATITVNRRGEPRV